MTDLWLVMDAGGTTCRLALAQGGGPVPGTRRDIPTGGDPVAVCVAYLAGQGVRVAGAVLAGAGPVTGNRLAQTLALTNVDFVLDVARLRAALGCPVHLVNDLVAQAHGLDALPRDVGQVLLAGTARSDHPRLLAGIGTGLNAAVLHGTGTTLHVPPSEAGQVALPALPELAGFNGLSGGPAGAPAVAEDLLSGPGLARLQRHLTGQVMSPAAVTTDVAAANAVYAIWAETLGRWLADLALVHLALGGIWLSGGAITALAARLSPDDLARGLRRAGAFAPLLAAIPVRIIAADDLALRGAARMAMHAA
jgi:glucokinase